MNLFKIKSLVNENVQEAKTLDEAKILAKWNFLKGYEIRTILSNELVERLEHFCPSCAKCLSCNHLRSEHHPDKERCLEKKCNCKSFVNGLDTSKEVKTVNK
jgi:hypothetical protein